MRFFNGRRYIGNREAAYFIADIAANHDGHLARAKDLIHMAAACGADAAKFQNFQASRIVSRVGFESLSGNSSHQATWCKSVYDVYNDASLPLDWTPVLQETCIAAGIDYFTSPYDFDSVDAVDPFVSMYKIGSGDITWLEMVDYIADKGKLVLLATGASDIGDVQRAVNRILARNKNLVLMQCNTNYTGSVENFRHVNLNVLRLYAVMFPGVALGLSDHTPGHSTVLGAVALGANIIEKHFTDDIGREGPDHAFSMTPSTWKEMVDRTRELENALGGADKRVAGNETQTFILQRRCLRASSNLKHGQIIERNHLDVLRPAPADAIFPYDIDKIIGLRLRTDVPAGEYLRWTMLE